MTRPGWWSKADTDGYVKDRRGGQSVGQISTWTLNHSLQSTSGYGVEKTARQFAKSDACRAWPKGRLWCGLGENRCQKPHTRKGFYTQKQSIKSLVLFFVPFTSSQLSKTCLCLFLRCPSTVSSIQLLCFKVKRAWPFDKSIILIFPINQR